MGSQREWLELDLHLVFSNVALGVSVYDLFMITLSSLLSLAVVVTTLDKCWLESLSAHRKQCHVNK